MANEIVGGEVERWTLEFLRLTDEMKAILEPYRRKSNVNPGPRLHELGCSDPVSERVFLLGGPHHEAMALINLTDPEISCPHYGGRYRRTGHATIEGLTIFDWVADPVPEKPETWHDRPPML